MLDSNGVAHTVRFSRSVKVNVYIKATILINNLFENDGIQTIKDGIAEYINNLNNGDDVYLSSLYKYFHDVSGVLNVKSLTLSTDGTTYSTDNIMVTDDKVARVSTDNIEVVIADE